MSKLSLPGSRRAAQWGGPGGGDTPTDLVFVNGRIHTMDDHN